MPDKIKSEYKEIKGAFKDASSQMNEQERLRRAERSDLGKFKKATFGEGSNVLRFDENGLWLGAETFATAPFRVDMQGNMYLMSQSGSGYILIDAQNSRFIFHDGKNVQGVMGFSAFGF